jgi:signal transduction histidine kinase
MRIAALPLNEEHRLQDLYSHDILDTVSEKEFDDLLEIAAHIYGCPMAAITFIDKDRQWFKAKKGIAHFVNETSRDISFCAHTILQTSPLVIRDTIIDERFYDNPLVTEGLQIRFYAGAPIISNGGNTLGTICVIDNYPRDISEAQTKTLTILAEQITKLLELRIKNKRLIKQAEAQLKLEKELFFKTLQAQEAERHSIGNELHENIAQGLVATKFYLELAEDAKTGQKTLIRKSKENILSIIQQVKKLSQAVVPSTLNDYHLKELLKELLSQFYNHTNITTHLAYEGCENIEPQIALSLYRIIQEQLENVQQHAKASSVTVTLQVFDSVYLLISDNGVGIEEKTFQKGVGFHKIVAQVDTMGGYVDVTTNTFKGCTLQITLPLHKVSRATA